MTTLSVNDITDVARILREQPEWADTIRNLLLSRELLDMPQRLAEYAAATDRRFERLETALAEFVESTNRRLEALEAGQARLEAGQARLEAGQANLEAGQAQSEARLDRLEAGQARLEAGQAQSEARLDRLEAGQARLEAGQAQSEARLDRLEAGQARLEAGQANLEAGHEKLREGQDELRIDVAEIRSDVAEIRGDMRQLRASHALGGAERETRRIARTVNCFQVDLLNSDDLYRMISAIDADDISRSDRDSFEAADIVIVGEHRESGETHYIAVEASFVAHEVDTSRAIRNAEYLTRCTGQPAYAVVASVHVDPSAEPIFAEGRVHWCEIRLKYLEPA